VRTDLYFPPCTTVSYLLTYLLACYPTGTRVPAKLPGRVPG